MINLYGEVIERKNLNKEDINTMYQLMDTFYEGMKLEAFCEDLSQKDYCILLRNEEREICGFSTQLILHIPIGEQIIHGVFSGDTIIHRDYWGSSELFRTFANFFFEYGEMYEHFYWFLISKGYKTYKMLPTFYEEFYPNYKMETPKQMEEIMHSFGKLMYPEEYEEATGVIRYQKDKDRLREGVADITATKLKDKDIAYFVKMNPEHYKGNDLVCITDLKRDNLHPMAKKILFRNQ